jgi:hypothetical protein
MTRVLVLAVVALAAAALGDALRPAGERETQPAAPGRAAPAVVAATGRYEIAGDAIPMRVLRDGREYLSGADLEEAFPVRLESVHFSVGRLAEAPDGTLAVAIHTFPTAGPAVNGIELWRDGRVVGAFVVPKGTFGGGLGWSADGRLVAGLAPDGIQVRLYRRDGTLVDVVPATSW